MEKHRTPDGEGGFITSWTEGADIQLVQKFDSTLEARRAEAEGVTSVYIFLAPKNCSLDYHDVVKRLTDGQTFRITTHANESVTPESASFNLTEIRAERWELP